MERISGICDTCRGPKIYFYIEGDERKREQLEISPQSRRMISRAITDVSKAGDYYGDAPIWSVAHWEPIIGTKAAKRLVALVVDACKQTLALLDGEICPECEGPVEKLYDAAGKRRGLYPLRPPKKLRNAFVRLGSFKASWTEEFARSEQAKAQVKEFGYKKKHMPDTAPVVSSHFLSGTTEQHRSARYPIYQLARAAGFDDKFVVETFSGGW